MASSKVTVRYAAACLALAAVYFAAGRTGLLLAVVNRSATAVWAPSGISIAALLLFGSKLWPGVFLGAFLVNLTTAGSALTWLGIGIGNTLEALAGAWLVQRFANGLKAFSAPRDVFKFTILAGGVSTILSATLGVISLAGTGYAEWNNFGPVWLTWWLGDAMGVLIAAPPIVLLITQRNWRWTRAKALEGAAMLAALILAGTTIFGGWLPEPANHYPLAHLCIPILLWSAFRFGSRETAAATAILCCAALWGTLRGFGGFTVASLNHSLLLLQAYMGVVSMMVLAVAARVEEHRLAESRLKEQGRLLALRNADLEQFAYAASHDLHEPLRTVSLYTQLLVKRLGNADEGAAELQGRITGGVDRMNSLIDALRSYSMVTTSADLHPEAVDMNEVVGAACENLASAIAESGAHISRGSLPVVQGHKDQLISLIQNLLGNAMKYRSEAAPVIEVAAKRTGGEWTFVVADNGIGIKPEYRAQIFELFKRLHTSRITGAGMGLAISKRIVELHEGRIWMEPNPGSGSRFCFTIPAKTAKERPE